MEKKACTSTKQELKHEQIFDNRISTFIPNEIGVKSDI